MATPGLDPRSDAFWAGREPVVLVNPRDPASVSAVQAAGAAVTEAVAEGLVYFLTSGSTGRPKIVGFTRAALLASARAVNAFLRTGAADVWIRVLPRFHVGGFQVEARAWAAGARCVLREEKWDGVAFTRACAEERVTLASLVPTQVHDLVRAGLAAPATLRAVLVGGGELRPALSAQARALGWPVRASYGLTEAASTVAAQAEGEPDVSRLTLLPHWEAATDGDGVLNLRGPALPARLGAWDESAGGYQWQAVLAPLRTRDRVRLDGRSVIFLGRIDRVVKRLGELVDLAQADRVLADAALAAGAFGRVLLRGEPDPRDGCRLVLECLDETEGRAVAERFNAAQPPFARLSEVRVVAGFRLSALGKPLSEAAAAAPPLP